MGLFDDLIPVPKKAENDAETSLGLFDDLIPTEARTGPQVATPTFEAPLEQPQPAEPPVRPSLRPPPPLDTTDEARAARRNVEAGAPNIPGVNVPETGRINVPETGRIDVAGEQAQPTSPRTPPSLEQPPAPQPPVPETSLRTVSLGSPAQAPQAPEGQQQLDTADDFKASRKLTRADRVIPGVNAPVSAPFRQPKKTAEQKAAEAQPEKPKDFKAVIGGKEVVPAFDEFPGVLKTETGYKVIPIKWNIGGEQKDITTDAELAKLAADYEAATGRQFPEFDNEGAALLFAATYGKAKPGPERLLLEPRQQPSTEFGVGFETQIGGTKQIIAGAKAVLGSKVARARIAEQSQKIDLYNRALQAGLGPDADYNEIVDALGLKRDVDGARMAGYVRQFLQASPEERKKLVTGAIDQIAKDESSRADLINSVLRYSADYRRIHGKSPDFTKIETVEDFANWAGYASGSVAGLAPLILGIMGTSAVGALVAGPPGAVAAPGALGYGIGVGDVGATLYGEGIDTSRGENVALAAGVPYALLEYLGPAGRLARSGALTVIGRKAAQEVAKETAKEVTKKTLAKNIAKEAVLSAAENFIGEGGQSLITSVADELALGRPIDITSEDWRQAANEALIGAIAGAGFGVLPGVAETEQQKVEYEAQRQRQYLEAVKEAYKKPGDDESPIGDLAAEGRAIIDGQVPVPAETPTTPAQPPAPPPISPETAQAATAVAEETALGGAEGLLGPRPQRDREEQQQAVQPPSQQPVQQQQVAQQPVPQQAAAQQRVRAPQQPVEQPPKQAAQSTALGAQMHIATPEAPVVQPTARTSDFPAAQVPAEAAPRETQQVVVTRWEIVPEIVLDDTTGEPRETGRWVRHNIETGETQYVAGPKASPEPPEKLFEEYRKKPVGTAQDPLRKKGDWQEATLVARNEDGTEAEVPAGVAVPDLMKRRSRALRFIQCLRAG